MNIQFQFDMLETLELCSPLCSRPSPTSISQPAYKKERQNWKLYVLFTSRPTIHVRLHISHSPPSFNHYQTLQRHQWVQGTRISADISIHAHREKREPLVNPKVCFTIPRTPIVSPKKDKNWKDSCPLITLLLRFNHFPLILVTTTSQQHLTPSPVPTLFYPTPSTPAPPHLHLPTIFVTSNSGRGISHPPYFRYIEFGPKNPLPF